VAKKKEGAILVVEDHAPTGDVLRRELAQYGRRVDVVTTLAAARTALAEGAPAAVFLDVRLPDGDGTSLLDELGRRWPGTRVAVITAYADVDVAVRAFRAGATEFLEKPFRPDDLHRVARDVLRDGGTIDVPDLRFETAERLLIQRALTVANGSKTKAAELLGINRATLYNKLHAYGLLDEAKGDDAAEAPSA
jgi:DNA-binding NtrC family response regulator